MTTETKKFHIDTVASVVSGRIISPVAAKEYFDLCNFLLQGNSPKPAFESFTDVVDLPVYVQAGLVHEHPEINKGMEIACQKQEKANTAGVNAPLWLKDCINEARGKNSDYVELQPFKKQTLDKLMERAYLIKTYVDQSRDIHYKEFLKSSAEGKPQTNSFALMDSDLLTKMPPLQENKPVNTAAAPEGILPEFPEYASSPAILDDILAIAKTAKLPVTANSFRKMNIKLKDQPVFAAGIDISEANYEPLKRQLTDAGIGEFLFKSKAKESGRILLGVDLKGLDDKSLTYIPKLSNYREQFGQRQRG